MHCAERSVESMSITTRAARNAVANDVNSSWFDHDFYDSDHERLGLALWTTPAPNLEVFAEKCNKREYVGKCC